MLDDPRAREVTVVIPTFNRRELLARTLDAVLRQRGVSLQVLVVDDGGTDGTDRMVGSLQARNVELICHRVSSGVARARNSGLMHVNTPFVAFVDDDDLWAPQKLEEQLARLRSYPGARWSCSDAVHVDSDLTVLSYSRAPLSGDAAASLLGRPSIPGGGSGVLVETQLARDVGGFDENISILADWDFYLRLSLCSPVASVHAPLVGYYVHADSMYHNPIGVVRELQFLGKKYSRPVAPARGFVPQQVEFAPDLAHWYVRLALMARAQHDSRTAVGLLVKGCSRAGVRAIAGHLGRRIAQKALRRPIAPTASESSGSIPFRKWPYSTSAGQVGGLR